MPQWQGSQSRLAPQEVKGAKVAHASFCPLAPLAFYMECWAVPVVTLVVSYSCGPWWNTGGPAVEQQQQLQDLLLGSP